jgi:hypothetical protein
VYLIVRQLGLSVTMGLAGMLLFFSLGWATKFYVHDFWLTDPLAFLFLSLAVLFAIRGQGLAFAFALVLGVLTKESVLFAVPVYFAFQTRTWWNPRLLLRTILLAAPAVVTLIVVHVLIEARNADPAYIASLPARVQVNAGAVPNYSLGSLLAMNAAWRVGHPERWIIRVLGTCGLVAGILPWVALRYARPIAIRLLPFLLLVSTQLLFARNNERLMVLGFPAIVALAILACEGLTRETDLRETDVLAFGILAFGLLLVGPRQWSPNILLQLTTVLAIGYIVRRRSSRDRRDRSVSPVDVRPVRQVGADLLPTAVRPKGT